MEVKPNITVTTEEYNAAIEQMKDGIEFDALLDFIDRLKEDTNDIVRQVAAK